VSPVQNILITIASIPCTIKDKAVSLYRLTAHGSRLTAHGSRLTAHGSRLTAHGSRLTAHGSRLTNIYTYFLKRERVQAFFCPIRKAFGFQKPIILYPGRTTSFLRFFCAPTEKVENEEEFFNTSYKKTGSPKTVCQSRKNKQKNDLWNRTTILMPFRPKWWNR
jgi:hypothetical protein